MDQRFKDLSNTHVPRAEHEGKISEMKMICDSAVERGNSEAALATRASVRREFDKEKIRLGGEVARLQAVVDEHGKACGSEEMMGGRVLCVCVCDEWLVC